MKLDPFVFQMQECVYLFLHVSLSQCRAGWNHKTVDGQCPQDGHSGHSVHSGPQDGKEASTLATGEGKGPW